MMVRFEVESWIGGESPAPVDTYWSGWFHRRARRVALKVVARYRSRDVRDFRMAIFDSRGKPLTWFLCEDGRYEELPDGSPRLAGYRGMLMHRRPRPRR